MKKTLLVLGMITCILGMTACGKAEVTTPLMTEAEAIEMADTFVEQINQISQQGLIDQYADYPVIYSGIESWNAAVEDMGDYKQIIDHEIVTLNDETIDIKVIFEGSKHNAEMEIVGTADGGITSITTSLKRSFGELMETAALNTLLGMGTVFTVLILISLIIYCFVFIPKVQAIFTKKPSKEEKKAEAVDHTIAQIIEKEELSDDLELVAVISAAIAASEGTGSTDGFVVRSIKRSNAKKWQRA